MMRDMVCGNTMVLSPEKDCWLLSGNRSGWGSAIEWREDILS